MKALFSLLALLSVGYARAEEPLPVTLTEVRVDVNGDGLPDIVSIRMTAGRRTNDAEPWCGMGDKYEGTFVVSVNILGVETVTELNSLYPPRTTLWFWAAPWSLAVSDYNHDGLIDFNLGQYGACQGWIYSLFTIERSGKVHLLPTTGAFGGVFNGDRGNSSFFPLTRRGFRNLRFDQTKQVYVEEQWEWKQQQNRFIVAHTRHASELDPK